MSTQNSRATPNVQNERVTFRLPKGQLEDVEDLVDDGEYPNRSEVFREAVRDFLRDGGYR